MRISKQLLEQSGIINEIAYPDFNVKDLPSICQGFVSQMEKIGYLINYAYKHDENNRAFVILDGATLTKSALQIISQYDIYGINCDSEEITIVFDK